MANVSDSFQLLRIGEMNLRQRVQKSMYEMQLLRITIDAVIFV